MQTDCESLLVSKGAAKWTGLSVLEIADLLGFPH